MLPKLARGAAASTVPIREPSDSIRGRAGRGATTFMLVEAQEPTLIDLDDISSALLLEQLRSGDSDVLIALTAETPGAAATVTHMTDEAIEVAIDDDTNIVKAFRAEGSCQVRFTSAKEHYCFDAAILSVDRIGQGLRLRVRRPRRVSLRQRRRFWRTAVRNSTTVELHTEHNTWHCKGAMLNVSEAGLACMVDRCDADRLRVGGAVHAKFRLDGDDAAFSVDAELKAETPTSDSARIILRLEFRWMDDTNARDRLDCVTRPSRAIG